MVTLGYKIADIGTDHGYVPISLIERKIIPSAIAMDIADGPLEIARNNIEDAGLSQFIEVRKSDGLRNLLPGEVDSIVLGGMGGHLIIEILSGYPEVTKSLKECIIQPQSEWERVRQFLLHHHFTIIKEDMVVDDGKYYLIMKVVTSGTRYCSDEGIHADISKNLRRVDDINLQPKKNEVTSWRKVELVYGKLLLEERNLVLKEYLVRETAIRKDILEQLKNATGEHIYKRREEVMDEVGLLNEALGYY